ncbi:MAG: serine/threonine protein kinase [Rhizobiales bacterium]|nr:serine/threonine protein kinase [Hyphomicrobiales bacterium]
MSNDPHALQAGTVIAGYRVVRVLGAGGFGITYEGESPVTGRRVAIKEFFPRGIASRKGATEIIYAERDTELVSWALKRFESSTTEQCRLKHPNIVEVFHYLAENDTGYMFMDYVEGATFEQWLRDRPNLPTAEEIRPMLEPVIDALDYLHSMNFIHRDVAPDNIMITADGRPVIIDFGAIKMIENRTLLQAKTVHSFMVGKQHYSPPEQTREGETLDARADIYALGAVFYRALAGRPPADTEERARKIAFGEGDSLIPLSEAAPHVPEGFAKAIEKALSFRANDRQGSIDEFRQALGWQGMSSSSAPTQAVIRSAATTPRNPSYISPSSAQVEKSRRAGTARWAAIAAALVLLVVGSAFAMMSLRSSDPQVAVDPKQTCQG